MSVNTPTPAAANAHAKAMLEMKLKKDSRRFYRRVIDFLKPTGDCGLRCLIKGHDWFFARACSGGRNLFFCEECGNGIRIEGYPKRYRKTRDAKLKHRDEIRSPREECESEGHYHTLKSVDPIPIVRLDGRPVTTTMRFETYQCANCGLQERRYGSVLEEMTDIDEE